MGGEPGQAEYGETSSPASSRIHELLPYLQALRNRCQSVVDFDQAALAAHESLVRGIRLAAAELDKRVGGVEELLAIAADPTETGYLFELTSRSLLTVLDTAVARKGTAVIAICIQIRPWLAPPTTAELLFRFLGIGPLAGRSPAGGYGCFETSVAMLCEENPWLDQAHRELHRLAGTAGSAEATGDLSGGPSVPLFCRVANLALELLEAAARLVRRPWTSEERARLYEDDYWDKPRSASAVRARNRRNAGWPEPARRTRFQPAAGNDLDSAIERAVFGADEASYRQAWESDPRIYLVKRGIPARSYLGPTPAVSAKPPDVTNALSAAKVRRAYDAFAFANRTGRILNAQLTISWFLLEGVDQKAQLQCFSKFYKNLKQWFRDADPALVPDAADRQPWIVHVHENPGGSILNTHFALAVPDPLISLFSGAVRGTLARVVPGGVDDRPLSKLTRLRVRRSNRHACTGQWFWFHYILKGANHSEILVRDGPNGSYSLGDVMAYRYQNPGVVHGREQIGVTTSLLPAAQRSFVDARGDRFVSIWHQQIVSGRIDVQELYSYRYVAQWEAREGDQNLESETVPDQNLESKRAPDLDILVMRPWLYQPADPFR